MSHPHLSMCYSFCYPFSQLTLFGGAGCHPRPSKAARSRCVRYAAPRRVAGAEEGYDAYGYTPAGEAATGFATGFEPATGFEAAPAPTGFEAAAAPPAPMEYAAAPVQDFGAQVGGPGWLVGWVGFVVGWGGARIWTGGLRRRAPQPPSSRLLACPLWVLCSVEVILDWPKACLGPVQQASRQWGAHAGTDLSCSRL